MAYIIVYSLKAAPTHKSELTEAASCCYIILNWPGDFDAPARQSMSAGYVGRYSLKEQLRYLWEP